jgi:hypothetical protein
LDTIFVGVVLSMEQQTLSRRMREGEKEREKEGGEKEGE